jgi:hypothetical protein
VLSQNPCICFALGAYLMLLAGCTSSTEAPREKPASVAEAPAVKDAPAKTTPETVATTGMLQVTLHVPEMTERLHLT